MHFKFSGMGVIRGLTRPLPVPGPLGVPGPYQVFPGTTLKTKIYFLSTPTMHGLMTVILCSVPKLDHFCPSLGNFCPNGRPNMPLRLGSKWKEINTARVGYLPGIVSCASIVSFFWPFLHQLVLCPPLVYLAGALCHRPGLPEIFKRDGSHTPLFKMGKSTGEGGSKMYRDLEGKVEVRLE